jgi:6-phosphogluconolactonase (cycloisomerase 2 family)
MIVTDPLGGDVLASDLGTDEVRRYRLDETTGRLRQRDPLVMPAGSGPRHLIVDRRYAYVVGELDSTVSVVDLDAERVVETVSTQPTARTAPSHPSAIRLSPDGRFLYIANRGPDDIAVLAVERSALELIGTVPSGGTHPRDLALDPAGAYLYVANQHSDAITAFRIDPATGLPEPHGPAFSTPSPTCIVFG